MNTLDLLCAELGRVLGYTVVLLHLQSNKQYDANGLQYAIKQIKDVDGRYTRVEYTEHILNSTSWEPVDEFNSVRIIFFENDSLTDFLSLNVNILKKSPEQALQPMDGNTFHELLHRKSRGLLINEYYLVLKPK